MLLRKKLCCMILTCFLSLMFLGNVCVAENEQVSENVAYVLIEAGTGKVLYKSNADEKSSVGQLNKLMTVLLVAEAIDAGKLTLEDMVKTSAYANTMQGAQVWLMPGEEMSVSDLLKSVIIGNANDATVSLAEKIAYTEKDFTVLMNKRASELGMKDTSFTNCNGFYEPENQISTAYDMALLAAELSKYDFLNQYFVQWLDYVRGKDTELVNSNKLVKTYDGIIGFKACYSDVSRNCICAGARRDNETYIAVVLNCKEKDDVFLKAKSLLNSAFANYQIITPTKPADMPKQIEVGRGVEKSVQIKCTELRNIVVPVGTSSRITSRVILPEYVYAPLYKNQKVGEIVYCLDDKEIYKCDIISVDEVEKIDFIKAMVIVLKNLIKL